MYDNRIILLDADVTIHFIRGNQLDVLPAIYDSEYWILNKVFNELYGLGFGETVNKFVSRHSNVIKRDLEYVMSVIQEYAQLQMRFGAGESAIMATAKVHNEVVASSNIRDVREYCIKNKLDWITTLDLLATAYSRGLLTGHQCNAFIQEVRNKGSVLPDTTITKYIRENS